MVFSIMKKEKAAPRIKIGIACMAVGAVLIIAALSLLRYNQTEANRAGTEAEEILTQVKQIILNPNNTQSNQSSQSGRPNATASGGSETPPATAFAPNEGVGHEYNMQSVRINGYDYIGYLSIQSLGLELPVMADWDYQRLRIAPCHYFGSVATEDLIICGHNYARHFGRLGELKGGDIIVFTQMDGEQIVYRVAEVITLQPTEVSEMINSDYAFTLYTCTYGGRARVTVRCDRVE